jgi:hypothetical protein
MWEKRLTPYPILVFSGGKLYIKISEKLLFPPLLLPVGFQPFSRG